MKNIPFYYHKDCQFAPNTLFTKGQNSVTSILFVLGQLNIIIF